MSFTQHIVFYASDEHAVETLLDEWRLAGPTEGSGFLGGRLLRFRDKPGRYVLQAEFDSWESAEANNDRQETKEWSERFIELIDGEPKYENLDVLRDF
jgi:quinol monooxygenase YgiN